MLPLVIWRSPIQPSRKLINVLRISKIVHTDSLKPRLQAPAVPQTNYVASWTLLETKMLSWKLPFREKQESRIPVLTPIVWQGTLETFSAEKFRHVGANSAKSNYRPGNPTCQPSPLQVNPFYPFGCSNSTFWQLSLQISSGRRAALLG